MSAKAIREATGKDILNRLLDSSSGAAKCQFAAVNSETNWDHLRTTHPWLETSVSCFIIFFKSSSVGKKQITIHEQANKQTKKHAHTFSPHINARVCQK